MIRKTTFDDIDSIFKITDDRVVFNINNDVFELDKNYWNKEIFDLDVLYSQS